MESGSLNLLEPSGSVAGQHRDCFIVALIFEERVMYQVPFWVLSRNFVITCVMLVRPHGATRLALNGFS